MKLKTRNVKQIMMVLSLTFIMGFVGCAKSEEPTIQNSEEQITQSTDNIDIEANEDEENYTISPEDYSSYEGSWTLDGAPLRDSGACLDIKISDGNNLEGDIYTRQSLSGRDAEIENISGTIVDGQCSYYFTDDGWDGSGILIISLADEKIHVEVKDYVMPDSNVIGYGIYGSYDFIRLDESNKNPYNLKKYSEDWDDDQILEELEKRAQFRDSCFFYKDYIAYMEQVRECTDIAVYCYPIYDTDKRYYDASDFSDAPWIIINIAKNEIYARHGYIFTDLDLYDFFMGQLWYVPTVEAEDFDDSVFNEYERANLQLLSQLDKH